MALLVGCRDLESPADIHTTETAGPSLATTGASPSTGPFTLDDLFARFASEAPEFGGLYYDSAGDLVVRTTDPGSPSRVRSVIQGHEDGRLLSPSGGRSKIPEIRWVRADFGFLELKAWRDRIRMDGWEEGMTLLDIDETRNRIAIGVAHGAVRPNVTGMLGRLGVPTGAVEVDVVPPSRSMQELTSTFDPVPGGVRMFVAPPGGVEPSFCTVGFNATTASGLRGFVVNSHCADETNMGTVTGQVILQPDKHGRIIGQEAIDPPFLTGTETCGGTNPNGCRWSDAAFIEYDPDESGQVGTIARTTGLGSTTIDPTNARFLITSTGGVLLGDTVHKVGQKTGWTKGDIARTGSGPMSNWWGFTGEG